MMEIYETPEMEVAEFERGSIVTTSGLSCSVVNHVESAGIVYEHVGGEDVYQDYYNDGCSVNCGHEHTGEPVYVRGSAN
jgi:hypothetical protein